MIVILLSIPGSLAFAQGLESRVAALDVAT
jgi:hypothetical protein